MKTSNKSPENTEITPSKKKLKQARLPFKLISETSPSPVVPVTRKRKLSKSEHESVKKVGKISKENDVNEDTVLISDDEGSLADNEKEIDKKSLPNPFVKLVDNARKKKLQKKKKSSKKLESLDNKNANSDTKELSANEKIVEEMDVDIPQEPDLDKSNTNIKETCNGIKKSPKVLRSRGRISNSNKSSPKTQHLHKTPKAVEVLTLTDSDNSSDTVSKNDNRIGQINSTNSVTENSENLVLANDHGKSNIKSEDLEKTKIVKTKSETKAYDISSKKQESIEKDETDENLVTPKRSTRNKTRADDKNKSTSTLNDSIISNPTTPKNNKSLSVTNSLDDSLNDSSVSISSLTPKQVQKKLEAAKKKEEREKEKQEREKKKQQEKEDKVKQKQEKEELKKKEREEKEEAKRKEKEEKEEQKRKEKEEKDRQKELEKKLKEEKEDQKRKEREEKEELKKKEKEARDEEKRKKQEALELEKQEQELKKKKAAEAFVNFFVPKQKSEKDFIQGQISKNSVLSSFTIKSDMRLAPTVRVDLTEEKKQNLDESLTMQNAKKNDLYIKKLKNGCQPLSSGKTWPITEKDDDVMIVEDELPPVADGAGEIMTCDSVIREKLRPKLLSFHDNRRPPYWGTWRKRSSSIKPRQPFGQDQKQLDYDVDSDDDWEEEQEGESIDGSAAGSDDEQDADEYEVDNDLFVPHGYLSDEEATMDENDVLKLSPESQQARLKHLEDEFETEMKKPTEKLKPRLYGVLWEKSDGGKPENCVDALWNYFGKFAMITNDLTQLVQPTIDTEELEKKKIKKKKIVTESEKTNESPKSEKKKKAKAENKDCKPKIESKKNATEVKKNQPGINAFLTKLRSP